MRTIKEALVAIALEGHRWPKENKRATNTQFILDQLHVDCTKEILEQRKTRGVSNGYYRRIARFCKL